MADEPSEEAVGNALRGMLASAEEPEAVDEEAAGDVAVAEEAVEEQVDETPEAVEEVQTSQGTEGDDIASLRSRLEEREAAIKRAEEQLAAVTNRSQQSLDIVRRKALRYASERDKARQILERALSADGVDKAEAERLLAEIRAGYNPESANYAPPPERVRGGPTEEDRDEIVNQFLIDKRFTESEAQRFAGFLSNPANLTPSDQRIGDLYSLLAILEPRWRSSEVEASKPDETVRAVKTVQNVQRRAARAAAAGVGASKTNAGKRSAARKSTQLSDSDLTAAIQELMRG